MSSFTNGSTETRLSEKCLPVENTLAYCCLSVRDEEKSYIAFPPAVNDVKLFFLRHGKKAKKQKPFQLSPIFASKVVHYPSNIRLKWLNGLTYLTSLSVTKKKYLCIISTCSYLRAFCGIFMPTLRLWRTPWSLRTSSMLISVGGLCSSEFWQQFIITFLARRNKLECLRKIVDVCAGAYPSGAP